jgi:hypothetical protein
MPYVRGFLEIVQGPHPEHPIAPTPPGSGPVDPGYGVEAPPDVIWGGRPPLMPTHPIALPTPPPGVFPPPSIANPIVPVPPTVSPQPPPGEVWPPLDGAPQGKFWMVVYVPGMGFKYVLVDPSLKPTPVK